MQYQWYPGHMVKAKRLIKENLKLVDLVLELLDARIPLSSRNPDIDEIVGQKPRIILLSKCDLADKEKTNLWINYFTKNNIKCVEVDLIKGTGLKKVLSLAKEIGAQKHQNQLLKGRINRPTRMMILGIPNVGKSTLINKLANRSVAQTGDKPGVTKNKQWIKTGNNLEMMDTPGVLWPKFDDEMVGFKLAVTGAIKDEIVNVEDMAYRLIQFLMDNYPGLLSKRYGVPENTSAPEYLIALSEKRGFLKQGNTVDYMKGAEVLVREFRQGKLGRITLDLL
ncbi:ribosome biogenesis GTPase YlqF [Anaerobranca gottschalkii]|uniref:Ribosome biogenesis GTPase A n=1 Tax=Anaerobranca gottschalkii DSM 13577 TaxID=1120990 RepID=A0A1I0BFP6_9FIRM|nr:ribosome biogenesis GTPase YlqF [Anaerobranca gottschalkii]SET05685.1 ribosome biogenesis GTPase A [Anaerobranca gottschalkii DSM 13577]